MSIWELLWCAHANNEMAGASAVAPPTAEEFDDMVARHYAIVNPKPKPAVVRQFKPPDVFAKVEAKRRGG
jgi:hypothetical protein